MNGSTVVILGAGASKPYGLPLGRELRDLVLKISHYDPTTTLLKKFSISERDFRGFKEDLRTSAFQTVDAFLEKRPQWMKIGKVATAIALGSVENELKLFPPNQPKDHWYEALWHTLECGSWAALKKKNVRIVSFNYDRTLECYLCGVIANNFRITRSLASGWLTEEFVVHPHGTLGKYNGEHLYQLTLDRGDESSRIKKALESIVVISQANPRTTAYSKSRSLLEQAKTCIFLGFGFHEQNITRLGFPKLGGNNVPLSGNNITICASHRGIHKDDWRVICREYLNKPFLYRQNWPNLSRIVSENI
jgi:hypothetical protein